MLRKTAQWLGLAGLMLGPLSCTTLGPAGPPGEPGTVGTEALPNPEVVPIEWGDLVAVTGDPKTNTSVLWFQSDSGAIRTVGFDRETNQLWPTAAVIRRR